MSEYQSSGKLEDESSDRVKLMCSYGGKILPRPHDNELRYVGGETRVLFIARNIRFVDLMSKLTRFYGNVLVFKYQLPGEDLDALVSVLNDEDLEIMMEEFDRLHSNETFSRIRSFLFHLKQSSFPESLEDARDPEQRFLDAINELPSVSRRHMTLLASAPDTDYLFGLDGLANQRGYSAALRGKPFTSLSTSPALQNSPSDKESAYPLHSIASSQRVALLYRPQKSSKQQLMLNATSATEKPVFCPSVATTQSHSLSSYNDFQSSTRRTYVPLVEVSRDRLPKGMVLTRCSVEDSLPISSLDSPRFKLNTGIVDDLSDMSEQSLEEQLDAYACFKEIKRLPEKEEIISGFNNNDVRDFDSSVVSSGLRRLPFSDQRLNLLHQNNADDHYRVSHYVSAGGSNADLCLHHQHRRMEDVDYQNLESSSREYRKSENNGKKMTMQRIASDPMLSSQHPRQNMHSLAYSSNRTSGAIPWQTNDDQRQLQHHEGDGSLPRHMVFLPKPQLPARPMHRVASAPNIVKAGADSLPPRYVATPHAPPSFRQHHDQQSPAPQHAPPTMRSLHSTRRSPSRLREPSPSGFQEHPASSFWRHNSYHDSSANPFSHIDTTMLQNSVFRKTFEAV